MTSRLSKTARLKKYTDLTNNLADNNGKGKIEGVRFEIFHETLNQDEFNTFFMLGNFAYLPNEVDGDQVYNTHRLWFPWFGNFDLDALIKRTRTLTDRQLINQLKLLEHSESSKFDRENHIDRLVNLSSPKYFVESDDIVTIKRTEDIVSDQKYLHQHDSVLKYVYLMIIKYNGKSIDLVDPYIICAKHRVLPIGESTPGTLVAIMFRLLEELNLNEPKDLRKAKCNVPLVSCAMAIAYDLFKTIEPAWRDSDVNSKYSDEDVENAEALLDVVNDAALLGFVWAKFEADRNMRPLAEKEEWRRGRTLVGAIESVKRRKEKAQIKWRDAAEDMAKKERQKSPSISQDDLADYISDHWSLNDDLPRHARLKQFISELENSDRLPKRIPGMRRSRQRAA